MHRWGVSGKQAYGVLVCGLDAPGGGWPDLGAQPGGVSSLRWDWWFPNTGISITTTHTVLGFGPITPDGSGLLSSDSPRRLSCQGSYYGSSEATSWQGTVKGEGREDSVPLLPNELSWDRAGRDTGGGETLSLMPRLAEEAQGTAGSAETSLYPFWLIVYSQIPVRCLPIQQAHPHTLPHLSILFSVPPSKLLSFNICRPT